MPNSFDSYIKQLQELEQSDNRASLYSFCSLNEPILSYFKSIWGALQTILISPNVDSRVIDEIKPLLVRLSDIKDKYEFIKRNPFNNGRDDIKQFQFKIDSLTPATCNSVWNSLLELERHINEEVASRKSETVSAPEPKKTERTTKISFKFADGEQHDKCVNVYFNGKRLGPPPCSIEIPFPLKKYQIILDYLPKKKRVIWKDVAVDAGETFYVRIKKGFLMSEVLSTPVALYRSLFGELMFMHPNDFSKL